MTCQTNDILVSLCSVSGNINKYVYQTLLPKVTYSNSYIHSYTDGAGRHATWRPAHQEQFGVQDLAQGNFDMKLGGAGIRTSDLLDGSLYLLGYRRQI